MEKCLGFCTVGRMLVLRENARPPTNQDWAAFCEEIARLRPKLKDMRALVFTDGGGPTSDQRKKLSAALKGSEIRTAVITDRTMVRFIVSTIGLFNKTIRTFHTNETPDAFTWLELQTDDRNAVKEVLRQLETTVSGLSASVQSIAAL